MGKKKARLFPTQAKPKGPSEMLSKLLRPELVRSNPVPLSSDAFSGFQKYDPDRSQHNREVFEATKRLMKEVIPSLARSLVKNSREILDRNINLNVEFHRYIPSCYG